MKKVLFILAPKGFRDEEYLEPRKILERGGIKIKVASFKLGTARGIYGTKAKIDLLIDKVIPEDYAGIVFIGGHGMTLLRKRKDLSALAKEFYKKNKLVSAICVAPTILANARLLKGKKATVYPKYQREIEKKGVLVSNKKVVVSDRIITGKGPEAAKEFGETILKKLKIDN